MPDRLEFDSPPHHEGEGQYPRLFPDRSEGWMMDLRPQ
jgi:hypothetical protein